MKRPFLILTIVMATLMPGEAPAQQRVPPPVILNVPLELQRTPVWCWAAVTQMAIEYRRGSSLQQCQMLERIHNLPPGACCVPPMLQCAHGAQSLFDIQRALLAFGGVKSEYTAPLQPMELYAKLQHGEPVVVHIRSSLVSSHVVIARGMRFEVQPVMTPFGPTHQIMPIVLVNDPLSFIPGEVPYARFMGIWTDALVIKEAIPVQTPSSPPTTTPTPPSDDDGHAASGPPPVPSDADTSEFCRQLKRVIAAAPAFASVRVSTPDYVSDDGDSTSYPGTVHLTKPGYCDAWKRGDGTAYYSCDIVRRTKDCDAADEGFDRYENLISSCLSTGWVSGERPSHTASISRRFVASRPGMPDVSMTEWRFASTGNCNVSMTVE